ncbi:MAG TPA: hypothetical protein DCE48_09880 [Lachnospiraceae bacterium]|nr:hypothetical protein [Lachnospiraceae bacterium]
MVVFLFYGRFIIHLPYVRLKSKSKKEYALAHFFMFMIISTVIIPSNTVLFKPITFKVIFKRMINPVVAYDLHLFNQVTIGIKLSGG